MPFDVEAFLRKVSAGVTLERFHKNQQIYLQGEPANTIGYLRKGRVKATVLSDHGKEAIVGIFQQGQFFCESSLNGARLRSASISALEECLVTSITREAMLSTLASEPAFSEFFVACLLSRNARLEDDVVDQLLHSSERRLARLLLLLANSSEEGDKPVSIVLSQEALADMIGATRSRVSTFMNSFREKGFISYDRHSGKMKVYTALLLSVLNG